MDETVRERLQTVTQLEFDLVDILTDLYDRPNQEILEETLYILGQLLIEVQLSHPHWSFFFPDLAATEVERLYEIELEGFRTLHNSLDYTLNHPQFEAIIESPRVLEFLSGTTKRLKDIAQDKLNCLAAS